MQKPQCVMQERADNVFVQKEKKAQESPVLCPPVNLQTGMKNKGNF